MVSMQPALAPSPEAGLDGFLSHEFGVDGCMKHSLDSITIPDTRFFAGLSCFGVD